MLKYWNIRIATITAAVLIMALNAYAAPPAAVNVHGQLVGTDGTPVSGDRAYTISFFDAAVDGNLIGAPVTGTATVSSEGLFNLAVEPPAGILTAPEVWYAIGVDTDTPPDNDAADDVFPNRIRVYSVPFALQAEEVVAVDADRVGDGTVDNAELDALDSVTSNVQGQIDAIDTSGIATNATAITQNTNDITQNTNDITQNTNDITQNTNDITQNMVEIGTNAADIALKANSVDVYTRATIDSLQFAQDVLIANKANSVDTYLMSEADTKFVDATGDTMSGALGVDTVTEATADAGVTIDGILLLDGVLALPQTAPADTTEKLYNFGSELFWGDAQITNVTTNKDNLTNDGILAFDWVDDEIADDLTILGGTVDNDSFSALSDLGAESAIGAGAAQVAPGDHDHDLANLPGSVGDAQVDNALTILGGTVDNDSFSALSDLSAEAAIGIGTGQLAEGDHDHDLATLSGSVSDAQVADDLIIIGGTVDNDSFSALGDLNSETAIGTGAAQVAPGDHDHVLANLAGSVNDAQVDNALTILGGTVDNDSFSAFSDLIAESALGAGPGQVAEGVHGHFLESLSGAVTDAQVPDDITITEADTLASVTNRGSSTTQSLILSGVNQFITFTEPIGNYSINSLSMNGLTIEGININEGVMYNAREIYHVDDSAAAPAHTYANDANTGIHRPGEDQLAMVSGGASRLIVDNAEVNLTGNILEVASGAAPGVIANKLYNTAGNLFWNGTQLDTGGGSTYAHFSIDAQLNSTTATDRTYWATRAVANGSIVGITTYCRDAGLGTFEIRINGIPVHSGSLVFFSNFLMDETGNILDLDNDFFVGDTISFYTDTVDSTNQATVVVTVQY